MRYQFFLDARDYVKYALLDDLMAQLNLGQLTIVWMLTPDVGNTHGSRRPKFDESRSDLNLFFQQVPRPNLRDVKDYFSRRGYVCNSYGDRSDAYITRASRDAYFRSIESGLLKDALVFLDPDNGVEPRSGATPFHVRLNELRDLWNRMGRESVLVIYQHLPRKKADVFWPDVSQRVAAALDGNVIALPFGDVGFLFASRRELREILKTEGQHIHETPS
jgi:hypothetical protein